RSRAGYHQHTSLSRTHGLGLSGCQVFQDGGLNVIRTTAHDFCILSTWLCIWFTFPAEWDRSCCGHVEWAEIHAGASTGSILQIPHSVVHFVVGSRWMVTASHGANP